MTQKAPSEALFERFCESRGLLFTDVPEADSPTVDYLIHIDQTTIAVEIKALEQPAGWNPGGVSSRTIGSHIRAKVEEARKQIQAASSESLPTILLIHNLIDPCQAFGTEPHDFLAAMYGDHTVRLVDNQIADSFYGRNGSFRGEKNTSFSALGHLYESQDGLHVHLYENVFAKKPLPYDHLPECIHASRVQLDSAA